MSWVYDNYGSGYAEMYLRGAEDNTLAKGKRGRAELSDCFAIFQTFSGLTAEEQAFRRVARDVDNFCRRSLDVEPRVAYQFSIELVDTPEGPVSQWDAIVTQWHNHPDRNLYKTKKGDIQYLKDRTAADYANVLRKGGVFEAGIQPPLSFRIRDNYFYILATSHLSIFSPTGQNCHLNLQTAPIGITKSCPISDPSGSTPKTISLLHRSKIGEFLKVNEVANFEVRVHWSTIYNRKANLTILLNGKPLVSNWNGYMGTDDQNFPYFKAGVYRLNGNAVPTRVRLHGPVIETPY